MKKLICILSLMMLSSSIKCQAFSESLESLISLAKKGNAEAQYKLGNKYFFGDGVIKDYSQAVYWYRKAAKNNEVKAQCSLGYCYETGNGVKKDLKEAVDWYRKAAKRDYAVAQCNLGVCFYHGNGVKKDLKEAVEWYRKAAEHGLSSAQNWLGICYYKGDGVIRNYAQALYWYRKAADQGDEFAQYNLGTMYYNGEGCEKDYAKALPLYLKAAQKGHKPSLEKLKLYSKVTEGYYKAGVSGSYCLVSTSGKEILRSGYQDIEIFSNDNYVNSILFRLKKDGKYGLADEGGNLIIPCETEDIESAGKGYFKYVINGSKGMMNYTGKIVKEPLKPEYQDIEILSNGNNSNTVLFKLKKDGKYGLAKANGTIIIPCETEALESAGKGFLKYMINGFWGVINSTGEIIIDTSRGYTSIGDYVSFTKRFPYTMDGYKGECDVRGEEISKIEVGVPRQSFVEQDGTTQEQEEKRIVIEHKHDPIPMQVWNQCKLCGGSGRCSICGGAGYTTGWAGVSTRCTYGCGGSGKCSFCAGQGGHYEVEYR